MAAVLKEKTRRAKKIDITGAIGFKRHIQVLNYMLTNWPEQPILYKPSQSEQQNDSTLMKGAESENLKSSEDSLASMKRVSLTRRLSRVISCEEEENLAANQENLLSSEEQKKCSNNRSTVVSLGSIAENTVVTERG